MGTTTLTRKNGTVTVTESDKGWTLTGVGPNSRFRMTIPRCWMCDIRPRPVCTRFHRGTSEHHRHVTFGDSGTPEKHARGHCHDGHPERIHALALYIGRTYGPAVKP